MIIFKTITSLSVENVFLPFWGGNEKNIFSISIQFSPTFNVCLLKLIYFSSFSNSEGQNVFQNIIIVIFYYIMTVILWLHKLFLLSKIVKKKNNLNY